MLFATITFSIHARPQHIVRNDIFPTDCNTCFSALRLLPSGMDARGSQGDGDEPRLLVRLAGTSQVLSHTRSQRGTPKTVLDHVCNLNTSTENSLTGTASACVTGGHCLIEAAIYLAKRIHLRRYV